jgi:tripartite-type tricarboxylate transporter receptor subunit TctC
MKFMIAFALAHIAFAAYAAETAREYPARPVRLVNPFPPGGSSDPSCRLLADALTRSLGQQ